MDRIDPDGKDWILTVEKDKKGKYTIVFNATVYIKDDNASPPKANSMNNFAKRILKTHSVNDINVKININYGYDKNKTVDKLNRRRKFNDS